MFQAIPMIQLSWGYVTDLWQFPGLASELKSDLRNVYVCMYVCIISEATVCEKRG